jgi:hypothetical protein
MLSDNEFGHISLTSPIFMSEVYYWQSSRQHNSPTRIGSPKVKEEILQKLQQEPDDWLPKILMLYRIQLVKYDPTPEILAAISTNTTPKEAVVRIPESTDMKECDKKEWDWYIKEGWVWKHGDPLPRADDTPDLEENEEGKKCSKSLEKLPSVKSKGKTSKKLWNTCFQC